LSDFDGKDNEPSCSVTLDNFVTIVGTINFSRLSHGIALEAYVVK
jgi:hypothetical protein